MHKIGGPVTESGRRQEYPLVWAGTNSSARAMKPFRLDNLEDVYAEALALGATEAEAEACAFEHVGIWSNAVSAVMGTDGPAT